MQPSNQPAPPHQSIVVHAAGSVTGAELRCSVDGAQVPIPGPSFVVPVAPGRHHIELEARSGLTPYGEVELEVEVPPQQQVAVYYALPRTTFSTGRIGLAPQRRAAAPDWAAIGWALVGVALVAVIAVVVALLKGNLG